MSVHLLKRRTSRGGRAHESSSGRDGLANMAVHSRRVTGNGSRCALWNDRRADIGPKWAQASLTIRRHGLLSLLLGVVLTIFVVAILVFMCIERTTRLVILWTASGQLHIKQVVHTETRLGTGDRIDRSILRWLDHTSCHDRCRSLVRMARRIHDPGGIRCRRHYPDSLHDAAATRGPRLTPRRRKKQHRNSGDYPK